jgi:hypothetical protein
MAIFRPATCVAVARNIAIEALLTSNLGEA